jgi:hypothetical protein
VALLFGGALDFATYSNEVWSFDLATDQWHLVAAREDKRTGLGEPTLPSERFWPELVASGDGMFFTFGGHDLGELGNRNDFWRFTLDRSSLEGGEWKRIEKGDRSLQEPELTSPERRDEHSLLWLPSGPWLFGGTTDCGPIDDMWIYGADGWTSPLGATISETCVRRKTSADQFCAPLSCAAPLDP